MDAVLKNGTRTMRGRMDARSKDFDSILDSIAKQDCENDLLLDLIAKQDGGNELPWELISGRQKANAKQNFKVVFSM